MPWQSQVAVHVGKHVDVDAAIGRPAQSHVAVHVGEQRGATMGLPEQSQVDVHCGEHLPAASPDPVVGEPAATNPFAVLVPVVPAVPGRAAPTAVGAAKAFLPATVVTGVAAVATAGGAAVSMGGREGGATLASSAVTTPVSSESLLTSHPVRATSPTNAANETSRKDMSLLVPIVLRMLAASTHRCSHETDGLTRVPLGPFTLLTDAARSRR